MPETIEFTLELGLYGANYKAPVGALWRVSFYDRNDGQLYAGSDDCPWRALAWAFDERAHRRAGLVRAAKSGEPTLEVRTPRAPAPARFGLAHVDIAPRVEAATKAPKRRRRA